MESSSTNKHTLKTSISSSSLSNALSSGTKSKSSINIANLMMEESKDQPPPRNGSGNGNGNGNVKKTQPQKQDTQQDANSVSSKSSSATTSSSSSSSAGFRSKARHNAAVTAGLVLFLGSATAAAFLGIGVTSARNEQEDLFERAAADTTNKIRDALDDYVNAVAMVHARCRRRNFSRQEFRDLYEYLIHADDDNSGGGDGDGGLQFKAVQFYPNTTHAERPAREADSRAFYEQHYPQVEYRGFVGFNELDGSGGLQPRQEEPWYFPVHYMEPIAGNEAAIDLDYHSSEVRIRAVNAVFENKAPSLSDRLTLVRAEGTVSRCGDHDGPSYGVVLAHPGVELTRTSDPDGAFSNLDSYGYGKNGTNATDISSGGDDVWPRDIAAMVLCIPDLLIRSTINQDKSSSVYIHDLNHLSDDPVFMGAADVQGNGANTRPDVSFLDEKAIGELKSSRYEQLKRQANVTAANRIWTITVIALDDTYKPNIIFVAVGGVIIFVCTILVSLWIYTNARRVEKWNEITTAAQTEKAALILENAKQQAKTERELNDFLAHEVRNPVAAAMAACNFVAVAVNQENPLPDKESRELARDDLKIIDNALHFMNDLLRNMLDMHRAFSNQLQVTMVATDLIHDVIEPVAGMLHRRGSKIKMLVECPPDLIILTDPLRLKQVILNLGRNSSKFIDVGFIKLTAVIVDGLVRIYVDDSGCGVPEDKHQSIFNKFQESLDVLSQGTVSETSRIYASFLCRCSEIVCVVCFCELELIVSCIYTNHQHRELVCFSAKPLWNLWVVKFISTLTTIAVLLDTPGLVL